MNRFTDKQLEYITDTTCKYGHLNGWSVRYNAFQCSDCGYVTPLKRGEKKPLLISEVDLIAPDDPQLTMF